MTLQEIEEAAMRLPLDERERLAERLKASVMQAPINPEIERAWQAEIERRVRSVEDGTAELIPLEEVLRNLRQK